MSEFKIMELPGGEIVLSRTLIEKEDGVDDNVQFMLRRSEQIKLTNWIKENRRSWLR